MCTMGMYVKICSVLQLWIYLNFTLNIFHSVMVIMQVHVST